MPQKPLDASDETMRLTIRLPKRLTHDIDKMRGEVSRSEFLRHLIIQTVQSDMEWLDSLPEATAPVPDAHASGGMITIAPKPATKPKIVPAKKHLHRFTRGAQVGHVMRGTLQIPIYRYDCNDPSCDVTEERP